MDDAPHITWPTPRHIPTPNGSTLNPKRVDFIYSAIKTELVYAEQIALVERLAFDASVLRALLYSAECMEAQEDGDKEGHAPPAMR